MSLHLKSAYKRFIFNLNIQLKGLYKFHLTNFYAPKKGSLAEFISDFSKSKPSITFLQIGANDGFFNDPLYKFIVRDNWQGVLLEPQQHVFTNYLSKLHRSSKNIHALNKALDVTEGVKIIYKISFSTSRWATGLTSFKKEILQEAIDAGHVARCAERYGEELPEKIEDYIAEETISCISPSSLFSEYRLQPLHWVQIDTEGYDFEIIKMLDLNSVKPEAIAFEHSHLSTEDRKACEQYLVEHGYSLKIFGKDMVAFRN